MMDPPRAATFDMAEPGHRAGSLAKVEQSLGSSRSGAKKNIGVSTCSPDEPRQILADGIGDVDVPYRLLSSNDLTTCGIGLAS
jgi:hypothetical protein